MIIKKSSRLMRIFGILGALMLPAGVALQFLLPQTSHGGMALSGFLCGLGSTLLVFWAISALREKRRPGAAAEAEAAQKDERGQLITGKAAVAAFLAAAAAQVALMLYFLFAEMRLPCLLVAGALLLQAGVMAAARRYYGKKL
ncbi:MAG: hypothetical protein FWC27_03170 [Firmicutes bacterium]|nr:hypothetical protein [Bacillota bacterium]